MTLDFEWNEGTYIRHFDEVGVGTAEAGVMLPIKTRAWYQVSSTYQNDIFYGGHDRVIKVEINLNGNPSLVQYLDDVTHSGRMIVQVGNHQMLVSKISTYTRTGYGDKLTYVYELEA